jgi:hypothetical protein
MKRRLAVPILIALSLLLNVFLAYKARPTGNHVTATNANSRRTYFSVHDVAAAQREAVGRGVKVGIIDHYFGYNDHRAMYAGGKDFLGDDKAFGEIAEHGLWLATTLREIAPGVEIYALNATCGNEEKKVSAMAAAIRWAIGQKLDVLTYSDRAISRQNRKVLDDAVAEAVESGVVCTFIHYPHADNILPLAMFTLEKYEREADVNVWAFDYNVLFVRDYFRYEQTMQGPPPYLSVSSTSVVTAGIVAMMKEKNPALSPHDFRQVLIETSRPCSVEDGGRPDTIHVCPRVIDAPAAIRRARELAALCSGETSRTPPGAC